MVSRIKTAIDFYGLSAADLFDTRDKTRKAVSGAKKLMIRKAVSALKCRDKETGKTRTGHGKRPGWFVAAIGNGARAEDLAI